MRAEAQFAGFLVVDPGGAIFTCKILPARLMKSMEGFFTQATISTLSTAAGTRPEQEWLSKVRIVDTTQPLLPPMIKG